MSTPAEAVAPVDAPAGASRGPATAEQDGRRQTRDRRPMDRMSLLAALCVGAAVLPVIVAAARAIAGDWRAIGDNAYFAIRAADVFTEHHPLLGSWTSVSVSIGFDVNNPGPLFFDALAIPVRVGGAHAGLAVGVALVNIAAIVGIAAIARRQAGTPGVVAAMAAAAGLGWAMGSELLFEPWQPHSLLYPFLCFLFMVWALACGDVVMLPWAVGLGSYIVQTHVGYTVLVPTLGAMGLVVLGARLRGARRLDASGWPEQWRRASRCAVVAAIVAVVCWAQPVIEQIFGEGRGNVARLVSSVGDTGPKVGFRDAPSYVATLLALPPWWGRPSMSEQFVTDDPLPSVGSSLLGLSVIAVLLAVGLRRVWRRGDRPVVWLVLTAIATVVVALIGVATMPVGIFEAPSHQVRWLWPVAVFVTFAFVMAAITARRRLGASLLAVATLALAALNVPSMNAGVGPAADADAIPTVRELLPQLASLSGERGVLIDITGWRFAEPYTFPVMAELQRLGVPLFLADPGMVRQFGPTRAHEGEASLRLFVREGDAARSGPDGARRVAFVEALSRAEAAELARLEDDLRSFIADGGLVRGTVSAEPETVEWSDAQLRDVGYLFESRALVGLVRDDRLRVPAEWAEVLERYADLQYQADRLTVAVFVEPLAGDR
jgi:hypothetical protein